jgi:hypothetical protein
MVFIYTKRGKSKDDSKDAIYGELHKDLVVDLKKVKGGSAKSLYGRHQAVAMAHLLKAGPEYHTIDLLHLNLWCSSFFCCLSQM